MTQKFSYDRSFTVVILLMLVNISLLSFLCISCCDSSGSVVINEIMYAPRTGEPEWVEIYNNSTTGIDLAGWTIEDHDSTRKRILSMSSRIIETNGYACITEDSSGLLAFISSVTCPVLQPLNGWSKLNNTGDRIVLRDSSGAIIDALEYDNQWGGGDGKSLERIHWDWPSHNPQTWSTSISSFLSTPCATNSIYPPPNIQKTVVSVEPDPFDTKTIISFKLTVPTAIVKLEIYNIRGYLVRKLIDQEIRSSTGSVIWNGTDDTGQRLRMGVYILYFEAINAERGMLNRIKKTVTLAAQLHDDE